MDGVPFQLILFGLADRFLDPFFYGCTGYLLTYRCSKSISAKVATIVISSLAFLWMDDVWPAIATRSAKLAVASGDPDVAAMFADNERLGDAEFTTGQQSDLWDVYELDWADIMSAALFVPLGFQIGLIVTNRRWKETNFAKSLPPPPPGQYSLSCRPPPPLP